MPWINPPGTFVKMRRVVLFPKIGNERFPTWSYVKIFLADYKITPKTKPFECDQKTRNKDETEYPVLSSDILHDQIIATKSVAPANLPAGFSLRWN